MAGDNPIKVYDLVLASGVTLSPFVWRTKLAVLHKGLPLETVPTSYMQIKYILDGKQRRLPVLEDNGKVVPDSLFIADYLDATYPDRPALFRTKSERNYLRSLDSWMFATIVREWFSCYTLDQYKLVHEEDKAYVLNAHQNFIFKRPLEEVVADRSERLPKVRPLLEPLRAILKDSKWFGGDEPNQVDNMMLGHFLWCASLASEPPLLKDDPLWDWLNRGFDRYASVARDPRLYPLAVS